MVHPLEGLVLEIENQIKKQKIVNIIIDKETIDNMRRSMIKASIEAGGIDQRIKNFGTKKYSIKEDARWISSFIRRRIIGHKLKFITGGTEIHIVTEN